MLCELGGRSPPFLPQWVSTTRSQKPQNKNSYTTTISTPYEGVFSTFVCLAVGFGGFGSSLSHGASSPPVPALGSGALRGAGPRAGGPGGEPHVAGAHHGAVPAGGREVTSKGTRKMHGIPICQRFRLTSQLAFAKWFISNRPPGVKDLHSGVELLVFLPDGMLMEPKGAPQKRGTPPKIFKEIPLKTIGFASSMEMRPNSHHFFRHLLLARFRVMRPNRGHPNMMDCPQPSNPKHACRHALPKPQISPSPQRGGEGCVLRYPFLFQTGVGAASGWEGKRFVHAKGTPWPELRSWPGTTC